MRPQIFGFSLLSLLVVAGSLNAHGTLVSPASRVYRVYKSNPERPNFALAANAVRLDGKSSYYTWNEVSQNIPQAVRGGLKPGFDYSRWVPDGRLASGGRFDRARHGRTYAGLDQVSAAWPKTPVFAGESFLVDFLATAPHNPSVWDVWMTKANWKPDQPLRWSDMEFLGRPKPTFAGTHYRFPLSIPKDRAGHHVLWVAWQRDDPVGEVFFAAADIDVRVRASVERFGVACAGSNRRDPSLAAVGRPIAGGSLDFVVDQLAPRSAASLLLGARTRIDLGNAAPTCTLWATPDLVLSLGSWQGQALRLRLPLPRDLSGRRFAVQALSLDPGLRRPLPVALSAGVALRIGLEVN